MKFRLLRCFQKLYHDNAMVVKTTEEERFRKGCEVATEGGDCPLDEGRIMSKLNENETRV